MRAAVPSAAGVAATIARAGSARPPAPSAGRRYVEKDTVSIAFVAAAVAALDAPARRRVLERAGIPDALLAETGWGRVQARVTAAAFAALWLAVAEELDDEFFGLDRRRAKRGSFALVARVALGGGRLDRALALALRAWRVVFDDIERELRTEAEGSAVLLLRDRLADPERRRFAHETLLVMLHGLVCWLGRRRVRLERIEFGYPRPPHAAEYALMYTRTLSFGAPLTRVHFAPGALAAPVVQSEQTLRTFLRAAPQSVFLRYKDMASWTARLRRRLRRAGDAGWPTFEALAAEYGIASSTLRRRLESEGTSFQAVKDELRRDLAIDHLSHGGLSITEIAWRLGFQDSSAFHRAFKQWTGTAPGAYRRTVLPAG
jgi:AraC-like DNA-binding protein